MTGVYKPTEGIIRLDGQDITGKSTIEINKAGIARTFQNIRLFKEMSVLDNVKVGLHNHYQYSTLTGILRLPKYFKVEKEMNEKAMEILKVFDLDKDFHMTTLLIEHDMKLVGGICEKLTVLNFGQVLTEGETSEVLNDPTVITAYLGE